MTDTENEYDQPVIVDLVDYSVVTGSHPPLARSSHELDRFRWAWLLCQKVDSGLQSASDLGIELAQLPQGRRGDLDRVAHTRPRSAFTSSQGVGSLCVRRISARDSSAARMSAMSSASSMRRSRSSASITAATRRPCRVRKIGSWLVWALSMIEASCPRASETLSGVVLDTARLYGLRMNVQKVFAGCLCRGVSVAADRLAAWTHC